MTDPYQVLGGSRGASEDEIKQAYRGLAKKYHPDLHPGDKEAARKMEEINAAYDAIKSGKADQYGSGKSYGNPYSQNPYGQNPYGQSPYGQDPYSHSSYSGTNSRSGYDGDQQGGYGGPFGFGPFGPFGPFGAGQQKPSNGPYAPVEHYLDARAFEEALHLLSEYQERDAEWYYLSALANAGVGNRVTALNHARTASAMEPGNGEYRRILETLEQGGNVYRQQGQDMGFGTRSASPLGMCLPSLLACMFCNFCGGRFFWCL